MWAGRSHCVPVEDVEVLLLGFNEGWYREGLKRYLRHCGSGSDVAGEREVGPVVKSQGMAWCRQLEQVGLFSSHWVQAIVSIDLHILVQ